MELLVMKNIISEMKCKWSLKQTGQYREKITEIENVAKETIPMKHREKKNKTK